MMMISIILDYVSLLSPYTNDFDHAGFDLITPLSYDNGINDNTGLVILTPSAHNLDTNYTEFMDYYAGAGYPSPISFNDNMNEEITYDMEDEIIFEIIPTEDNTSVEIYIDLIPGLVNITEDTYLLHKLTAQVIPASNLPFMQN
jgi:hypothetical protein